MGANLGRDGAAGEEAEEGAPMRFIIEGPPVTKKNSPRILRGRNGRPFVAPSKASQRWQRDAAIELLRQYRRGHKCQAGVAAFTAPVNLRALIYRKHDGPGDLDNYIAAVCDALQTAGIVANDRLIRGHDGSRLLVDRERPRVEIELTPLPG